MFTPLQNSSEAQDQKVICGCEKGNYKVKVCRGRCERWWRGRTDRVNIYGTLLLGREGGVSYGRKSWAWLCAGRQKRSLRAAIGPSSLT